MKPSENKDEHEVVKLRTITGGKDGGVNWLASLPLKTVFLCKDKKQGCILTQFHVINKYKKSALLLSNYPGPDFRVFVETQGFSAENELVEIIQEGNDGGSNSHSQSEGLD